MPNFALTTLVGLALLGLFQAQANCNPCVDTRWFQSPRKEYKFINGKMRLVKIPPSRNKYNGIDFFEIIDDNPGIEADLQNKKTPIPIIYGNQNSQEHKDLFNWAPLLAREKALKQLNKELEERQKEKLNNKTEEQNTDTANSDSKGEKKVSSDVQTREHSTKLRVK